ncbi:MAG TPA: FtsX-like permease family protein [Steroidobacteraceae bacterium]|nr:FtsX-like permease family protein [Steroidobacteraceae bacterium]
MKPLALLLPIAWRNLWRNPRRTGITLLVVIVGTWSILAFDIFLAAWAVNSRDASLRVLTGEGQIHAPGYLDDPSVSHRLPARADALLAALDSPLVGAWTRRVRVPAIIRSEYRTRAVTLLGVEPAKERMVSDLPSETVAGRYLKSPGDAGIVLGRDLAQRLKTRVGKRVVVMAQADDGHLAEAGFEIVGLFGASKAAEDEFCFTGLGTAQRLLGIDDEVSEISFDSGKQQTIRDVVARLEAAVPAVEVKSWMDLAPLAYTIERFSQYYIAAWLVIMFVLMAIGIVNTQLMAVFERTREFGLLQALGMRPRLILLQVVLESALLIGLGILAAIALTVLSVAPFHRGIDLGALAGGAELIGAGRMLYPAMSVADTVRSGLLVWLFGIAAALWPAANAARANPAVAMVEP